MGVSIIDNCFLARTMSCVVQGTLLQYDGIGIRQSVIQTC